MTNLRSRIFGPSGVVIGSTVLINVLRIGNTMVLTRLLAPDDFGLMSIILSVFFVIGMITDAGFEAYIVRHERGDEPYFLDAIWTIHFLRGAVNTCVALLLAYPVALFMGHLALAPLLAAAGLTMVIDGSSSLTILTALRNRMVRRLSALDFGVFLIQLAVGIFASWWLRNAWGLVISLLTYSVMRAAGSYLVFPNARRRLCFDRALAGELWRFSRIIGASSIITLLISQIDKLVLARAFTLPQFGTYAVASNLAGAPVAIVNMYTSRILYPAMAHVGRREPENAAERYYEMRGSVFYGYLLAAGGLIGAAPLAIRILYDPRYLEAGWYLRLLAIATAFRMLTTSANELMVAIGHTRTTLNNNFVRLVWLVVGGIAAYLAMGPIGLVWVLALVEVPPYVHSAMKMRQLHLLRPRPEASALVVIASGALVGALIDAAALRLFPWL